MKSFKEQLEKDFETTFFNTDEFAEIHELQGNEVPVVVDNDIIIALSLGKHADADGIFTDDKMIFVQKNTWNLNRWPVNTYPSTERSTRSKLLMKIWAAIRSFYQVTKIDRFGNKGFRH